MQPLTEFTIFGNFPTEIRQYIFSLNHAPRLIAIVYSPKSRSPMLSTTSPPGILGATRESRKVGLKSYEALHMKDGLIMVNWDIDTILDFAGVLDLSTPSPEWRQQLFDTIYMKAQNIAISAPNYASTKVDRELHHFKSLHCLSFYVATKGNCMNGRNSQSFRFVKFPDQEFLPWSPLLKRVRTEAASTLSEVCYWYLCERSNEEWTSSDMVHIRSCFYESNLGISDLTKRFP